MQITLRHTKQVARDITMFWFKLEEPMEFVAGQFIEMYLPHKNPDERGEKRWFTLSSSPTETLLAITTKHAVGQVSTFKQQLFALTPGATIRISEPMGDFVLPKDATLPLVFVAGGIGVTPMRSMVQWLTDTGQERDIHVIYTAHRLDELAFLDIFETYGTKLDIILSEKVSGHSTKSGRLTGKRILELAGTKPNQLIYVSGPEPMTETLESELLNLGISSEKLVLDFFPGYQLV